MSIFHNGDNEVIFEKNSKHIHFEFVKNAINSLLNEVEITSETTANELQIYTLS